MLNPVVWVAALFTVNILDLDNVDVELAGVFTVALSVVDMLPAGVSLICRPAGVSLTSSVAIVEIIDNDEASVALSVVDMLPAGVSLTSSVAIVEIIDNDELAVELGFDPVTYRVGEGSGTVELMVSVLSGDLTEPITLNYAACGSFVDLVGRATSDLGLTLCSAVAGTAITSTRPAR